MFGLIIVNQKGENNVNPLDAGGGSGGGCNRQTDDARKSPGGIFITMLLGVAGALVAGFLGRALGWYREGEPVGLFASIIGAVVLLGLYRLVAARRAL